jgi:hypothetical protein
MQTKANAKKNWTTKHETTSYSAARFCLVLPRQPRHHPWRGSSPAPPATARQPDAPPAITRQASHAPSDGVARLKTKTDNDI